MFKYIIMALILTRVPYIGKYFRIFNTLVHEIGHVIVSFLTSGEAYHVKLFSDTSGEALTGSRNKISQILVSLAGYPFSSIFGFVYLYLLSEGKYEVVLYSVFIILGISLLLWVRNAFGVLWVVLFMIVTYIIGVNTNESLTVIYLSLIVSFIVVESLTSTFELFIINRRDSNMAGDSSNLSKATGIPSMFWTILFNIVSVSVFILGVRFW